MLIKVKMARAANPGDNWGNAQKESQLSTTIDLADSKSSVGDVSLKLLHQEDPEWPSNNGRITAAKGIVDSHKVDNAYQWNQTCFGRAKQIKVARDSLLIEAFLSQTYLLQGKDIHTKKHGC